MKYRTKLFEEALDLDLATPAELTQWNVTVDDTMVGMVAMRPVGSTMLSRIIDRTAFTNNWEPIP